jgi:hypothetical protein
MREIDELTRGVAADMELERRTLKYPSKLHAA